MIRHPQCKQGCVQVLQLCENAWPDSPLHRSNFSTSRILEKLFLLFRYASLQAIAGERIPLIAQYQEAERAWLQNRRSLENASTVDDVQELDKHCHGNSLPTGCLLCALILLAKRSISKLLKSTGSDGLSADLRSTQNVRLVVFADCPELVPNMSYDQTIE